jgi:para-nitrobenzyl esterase
MMHALAFLIGALATVGQAENRARGELAGLEARAEPVSTPELRIESGVVRGLVVGDRKDVFVYKGTPYAAPPVSELRWKPPQPANPWSGVRDCTEFGAACPQETPLLFRAMPEMALRAPLSENCLFLNIWAPAARRNEKLPVLYWIHGGAFVIGAASQPIYDGEELARLGCVVVTVNYRLGLFGFLAHPALSDESAERVSGNYGLLDQIEGLRWVRRNIASFGGDPERVTIFGESAGGVSVLCLMVSPEARGLFRGAVAQSAAGMDLPRLRNERPGREAAQQTGKTFITACGLNDLADAAQMRRVDANTLVPLAPANLSRSASLHLKPVSFRIGPNVDGHVIPDKPNHLFAAGRAHDVPLIVGNTRDETALFLLTTPMPVDQSAYLKQLKDDFGDFGAPLAKAYPANEARQVRGALVQLSSDLLFVSEARFIARAHAATGRPTFRYQFSRGTKSGFFRNMGAHHGAELAYLFQRPLGGADEARMRLARTLGHYWIRFAATGDPNGSGVPLWPVYRRDSEEIIEFAEEVSVLKRHRIDQLDLIDKVLQERDSDSSASRSSAR